MITEEDQRFYIAESKQCNGGLGVFAKVPITTGECLEVIGVMVPKDDAKYTHYADDYKFAASLKNANRDVIPMGFGAIINHAVDRIGMNMEMKYLPGRNKISSHACSLVLMAIQDIQPDEECLHYYGDLWNETLHWKISALAVADEEEAEWDMFLSYKLYNLGFFNRFRSDESIHSIFNSP